MLNVNAKTIFTYFVFIAGLCGCTLEKAIIERTNLTFCEKRSTALSYNSIGSGTSADPHVICFPEQLYSLGKNSAGWNLSYIVYQDLDMSYYNGSSTARTLSPIGIYDYVTAANSLAFTGSFDGNGKKISGLTMTNAANQSVALFGSTNSAILKNVNLIGVSIRSEKYGAALVGYNLNTPISNVYVTGSLTATSFYAGGLIGWNEAQNSGKSATVTSSVSSVDVIGFDCVGGLIGYNKATNGGLAEVISSSSTGRITNPGGGNSIGGFIGYNTANTGGSISISSSFSTGEVYLTSQGSFSGGFVGTMGASDSGSKANITNSYAVGNFTSPVAFSVNPNRSGGFVGLFGCNTSAVCRIEKSFYRGTVTILSSLYSPGAIGGFIGNVNKDGAATDLAIQDCYFVGSIAFQGNSGGYLGGFVGSFGFSGGATSISVLNSYASASITYGNSGMPSYTGGFFGWNGLQTVNISSSYWNSSLYATGNGSAFVGSLVGLTNSTMTNAASFVGWDLANIWKIQEAVSSPELR